LARKAGALGNFVTGLASLNAAVCASAQKRPPFQAASR
jgi:hypothetical protein